MTPRRRPGPAGLGDPRLGRLLRWYPRAWRERYGAEFLALVEDTLDGDRPGWRLLLAVAWSGLRERGHATRLAGRQALPRLARGVSGDPGSVAIVAGYLAAILPHELGTPPARQTGVILDVRQRGLVLGAQLRGILAGMRRGVVRRADQARSRGVARGPAGIARARPVRLE